jgi:lipoyl(octanoyl) transferase
MHRLLGDGEMLAQTRVNREGGATTRVARNVDGTEVVWRGCEAYLSTYEDMRRFTDERGPTSIDQIWLVEHPPVFTLGKAGNPAHLLTADSGIPLIRVDRGGEITYHGPGQIVAYLLVDLRRRRLSIPAFVAVIEEAVIDTLAHFSIDAERKAGRPGIYITDGRATQTHAGSKISALGLRVSRGCTYHGLSLNVAMNLAPFTSINACGDATLETVDMATLGVLAHWKDVAHRLAADLVLRLTGTASEIQGHAS